MSTTVLLAIGSVIFLATTTAVFLVIMLSADAAAREQSDVIDNANTPPIDLRPSSRSNGVDADERLLVGDR